MVKVNRDFIDPAVAVRLAREVLADFDVNDSTSLAGYLPSQEVDDIEYEIEVGSTAGFITAANWRAFNGNPTSETWGEGKRQRGRFLPLARNYTIDEEGALRQRNNKDALIERESANLIRRGAKSIGIAINRQRANALQYGIIQIEGSGHLRQQISFGRNANFTTVADQLFTDDAADPLGYIEALADLYEAENGFRPERVMIPTNIRRLISQHASVVRQATDSTIRDRATQSELDALFAEYRLPQIIDTPSSLIQVDDLATGEVKKVRLFDRDSILFVPATGDPLAPEASIYGRTLWGRTKTADIPAFRESGADTPGVVAGVLTGQDYPFNEEVIIDALAMPVVYNANYTLKAKVIDLSGENDQFATPGEKAGLTSDPLAGVPATK